MYNPIIPVFDRPPKEWKREIHDRSKGPAIAKGYARFFEPDVYVEAEPGLIEKANLATLRQEHATFSPLVITLDELQEKRDGRDWSELLVGLNIREVLFHIYRTEQKFLLREQQESFLVKPQRGNALSESMFGVYPASPDLDYIRRAFMDVYQPESVDASPDTWRRVYRKGAQTPLWATRHSLQTTRYWHHDVVVFIFNPARATDCIDLWNMRLEPHPVVPIPLDWFDRLTDDVYDLLKLEHRPVVGNPNGVMHRATIEFGRSIEKPDAEATLKKLKPGLPPGAVSVKYWRNPVWVEHRDDRIYRDSRLKVVAKERRADLVVKEDRDQLRTTFEPLEPEFAERYGGHHHRWVNVLRLSSYGNANIAWALPFNTFDRSWPRLGMGTDHVSIGGEGWAFTQQFKNLSQSVSLLRPDEAIVGWFKQNGIEAKLSEPGHIAKQMLEHLGGLWGVGILADVETLALLNRMAGGHRRNAPIKDWTDLISRRRMKHPYAADLETFTKHNVIRLGLETECFHCKAKNWSGLTGVDYRIVCERCLKPYDFPQANIKAHNRNWAYRVVGPFSVPDFGRGSYSALLALRVLSTIRPSSDRLTFATAMDLEFDGVKREADFVAWYTDERANDLRRPPQFIIGEAKSTGKGDLITSAELNKLKEIAAKLPEAVIVIAVLRDHFTHTEQALLEKFVTWGRRVNPFGEPTNPVLLLTSHELTVDHWLSSTWKALGGEHAKFADYQNMRTLFDLADATQRIYLGMPGFHETRQKYWDARIKRLADKRKATQSATLTTASK
ncbi:hypothetical protein I6F36_21160 [Bradyrhizobium sp. BRP19]|uniref:hypothetical protein n=1 Tax=Bradyrhizobium sp. BRP19 TaxID=2793823 RepID=UPI001CD33B2B|nr:hypothetical protein [Bradyrhizobium sp. BRP19]MCA1549343.1 hypothetical protein [Bradyrhizobium sp. BRP19]